MTLRPAALLSAFVVSAILAVGALASPAMAAETQVAVAANFTEPAKEIAAAFKAATGQTPGEAIRRRQFEEARRLLGETELSVTLVAERSGFGSSSDFARRFRAMEGKSPLEFRRQARRR